MELHTLDLWIDLQREQNIAVIAPITASHPVAAASATATVVVWERSFGSGDIFRDLEVDPKELRRQGLLPPAGVMRVCGHKSVFKSCRDCVLDVAVAAGKLEKLQRLEAARAEAARRRATEIGWTGQRMQQLSPQRHYQVQQQQEPKKQNPEVHTGTTAAITPNGVPRLFASAVPPGAISEGPVAASSSHHHKYLPTEVGDEDADTDDVGDSDEDESIGEGGRRLLMDWLGGGPWDLALNKTERIARQFKVASQHDGAAGGASSHWRVQPARPYTRPGGGITLDVFELRGALARRRGSVRGRGDSTRGGGATAAGAAVRGKGDWTTAGHVPGRMGGVSIIDGSNVAVDSGVLRRAQCWARLPSERSLDRGRGLCSHTTITISSGISSINSSNGYRVGDIRCLRHIRLVVWAGVAEPSRP
ncbi:hypothetical protein HK405_003285 [Cladochytrium tenue]|nr:hypothetical protein HK405_003285 [Cladochytrium tenue]